MSNFMLRPSSKRLLPITHQSFFSSKKNKKKSNSQYKYFQPPDIIAQVKPSYLNNFIQPMNPHKSSFTPTNHSSLYQEDTFLLPQKSPEFTDKKTLILDLDETLVHSSFTPFEKNDIVLNVDFDGIMYNIYVLVRPGAKDFLKNISKYFEVVTFTASLPNYASPLLDILDTEHNIKYRLYREHCTFLNGIYIKDLKRLNRNIKDLIIVDNSPLAYAFHSENGLPIKTWYNDPSDVELTKISKLLEFLSKAKDVRNYIKKFVKDNEIKYDEAMNIIESVEKKNKNKIKKHNNNKNNNIYHNNNSFISKTNISTNNENNENIFNNNKTNINNANKINLIREFINFNNNPINMCALSSSKGENTKNQNQNDDSKRSRIKYKPNHDSNEFNKSSNNLNNTNKMSKSNKNKKISLNDIAVMNNIIKKQINDNFETGKMSQKLLLIKNVKQKQKANNTFRLGQKNDIKNTSNMNSNSNNNNNNNININSGFYNNKYNLLIPMGLPSSNTTKNLFSHQNLFHNNNININNNNKNKNNRKIHNKSSNINNSIDKRDMLKNNYLNMLQDKKQNNKKKKYTNLLNQFGNEGIKSYYQGILETNKILFNKDRSGFENMTKSPNLRISSSMSSHRNYSSIGKNRNSDKNFVSFHMPRSRSTGNFLKIGKQGKLSPKTPNRHMAFQQNDGELEKQNKLLSLFNGITFDDITRYKNNQNIGIGKNNGEFKFKRCKSSKKFK